MIIIGLLIGGILQGQNLIRNAEILSTANEIEAFDAGIATFREAYGAWPGDMLDADIRLRNCAGLCDATGDANNRVGGNNSAGGSGNAEIDAFFPQLAAADIITSVASDTTTTGHGGNFPIVEIGGGGGFQIGYADGSDGSISANLTDSGNVIQGHYIFMYGDLDGSTGGAGFTPAIISRLDRKLDDGLPDDGNMRAIGTGACTATGTNSEIYNETNDSDACEMALRVQG